MYYITLDGIQVDKADFWEEALISAAQLDFIHNSPEMNDGEIGKHAIEIKEQK